MKEFNLDEYLKNPSQKVVTRDGREVRIICTDMKSRYKIVGLVYDKKDDTESVEIFQENGTLFNHTTSNYDLFFAPVKKDGWVNLYKGILKDYLPSVGQKIYKSKENAIKNKRNDDYLVTVKIEWEE